MNKNNYFKRHWRGELSLPISFWVNGVLINFLLQFSMFVLLFGIMLPMIVHSNSIFGLIFGLFSLLGVILLVIWQTVGIWKSAGNHSRGEGSSFWAVIAQILAILGAFSIVIGLIVNLVLILFVSSAQ